MSDLCFICSQPLSESQTVNVTRGLQTLKSASISRNDKHIEVLNTVTSVIVHIDCRKIYVSAQSIVAFKRHLEEAGPSTSSDPPRKRRTDEFDFKTLCMFCGEAANEAAEMKQPAKYRRNNSVVSTISFKDNVIEHADKRNENKPNLSKVLQ